MHSSARRLRTTRASRCRRCVHTRCATSPCIILFVIGVPRIDRLPAVVCSRASPAHMLHSVATCSLFLLSHQVVQLSCDSWELPALHRRMLWSSHGMHVPRVVQRAPPGRKSPVDKVADSASPQPAAKAAAASTHHRRDSSLFSDLAEDFSISLADTRRQVNKSTVGGAAAFQSVGVCSHVGLSCRVLFTHLQCAVRPPARGATAT